MGDHPGRGRGGGLPGREQGAAAEGGHLAAARPPKTPGKLHQYPLPLALRLLSQPTGGNQMSDSLIARLNGLTALSRQRELTQEEQQERQELRLEYRQRCRENLRAQLKGIQSTGK